MQHFTSARKLLVAVGIVGVLFAASACSSTSSSSTSSGSKTESKALVALAATAKKDVAAESLKQTTTPPKTGPKAQQGKKILIVTCASDEEGCERQADGAAAAAKALGWKSTIVDGNNEVQGWNAGIQDAISQKYDGIVLVSIGSQAVTASLTQAKAAGIPVVGTSTTDPQKLFTALVPTANLWYDQGYLQGQNLYELSGGHINLLMFRFPSDPASDLRYQGTVAFIKACAKAGGDCTIAKTQPFTGDQIGPQLASLADNAIVTTPKANYVWVPFDASTEYVEQGLTTAGKSSVRIVGFDANAQTTTMIRQGTGEVSTLALPLEWIGWGAVDALNRTFAGQPVVDSGVQSKVLRSNNLPKGGAWTGDINYAAAYEKTWK